MRPLVVTGIGWQAWLAAALPVLLVLIAAAGQRVGRVGRGLLVATYALYLGRTFR